MGFRDWARHSAYRCLYGLTGPGRGIRIILLYHSVDAGKPHSISPDIFEQQMELLTRRFKIVRLCDLPEAMGSAPAETNLACVTFDDGYRDNYEQALPLLEKLGVKATFFIVAGLLGKSFPSFAGEIPMMIESQVCDLASLGHEIGAHTVTHPKLSRVPLATAHTEIEASKKSLEELLGREVVSFAYPKGHCNKALEELVEKANFKVAVTIREQLVTGDPDWLALPRVWIGSRLGMGTFAAKTSPAVDWYARLRGRSQ